MAASTKKQIKALQLAINREYETIVPAAAKEDDFTLEQSLLNDGQYETIKVNAKGVVLDGHRRLKILKKHGITPKIEIKQFANELEEKKYVIEVNLKRRHLNDYQKVMVALRLKPIEEALAKLRMKSMGKSGAGRRWKKDVGSGGMGQVHVNLPHTGEKGKVNEILAKRVGVSTTTFMRASYVAKKATKDVKEKAEQGRMTIAEAYNKTMRAETRETMSKVEPVLKLPDHVKLIHADLNDVGYDQIPPESVDLILVDPPYIEGSEVIYEQIATKAMRILKPGGSLVMYVGHMLLEKVIMRLHNVGLKFWWPYVLLHAGAAASVWDRKVFVKYKPILHYVKGKRPYMEEFFSDVINGEAQPKKMMHEWEQDTGEARHMIRYLTYPGAVIVDLTAGTGTVAAAVLMENAMNPKDTPRSVVCVEKDETTYKVMKKRVANTIETLKTYVPEDIVTAKKS